MYMTRSLVMDSVTPVTQTQVYYFHFVALVLRCLYTTVWLLDRSATIGRSLQFGIRAYTTVKLCKYIPKDDAKASGDEDENENDDEESDDDVQF